MACLYFDRSSVQWPCNNERFMGLFFTNAITVQSIVP